MTSLQVNLLTSKLISASPNCLTDELLYAEVDRLDIHNLVDFVNTITNLGIPKVRRENLVSVRIVDRLNSRPKYLNLKSSKSTSVLGESGLGTWTSLREFLSSPLTVVLSNSSLTFRRSRMTLFGIHADAQVIIGGGGFHCSGGVDAFSFAGGVITLSGVNSPRASYNLEFTKEKHEGTIDGMIELFGIQYVISWLRFEQ